MGTTDFHKKEAAGDEATSTSREKLFCPVQS